MVTITRADSDHHPHLVVPLHCRQCHTFLEAHLKSGDGAEVEAKIATEDKIEIVIGTGIEIESIEKVAAPFLGSAGD